MHAALILVVLPLEDVVIICSAVVFSALNWTGIVVEITTMAFWNKRNNIFCHAQYNNKWTCNKPGLKVLTLLGR